MNLKIRYAVFALFIFQTGSSIAQQLGQLTVEKIMRDPKWMGVAPSNIQWADNSQTLYFNWNPGKEDRDPVYQITTSNRNPQKVEGKSAAMLSRTTPVYANDRTKWVFERNGDLFQTSSSGKTLQLTNTVERESNPTFSADGRSVYFQRADNLYAIDASGAITQLTNFTRSRKRAEAALNKQDQWLKQDQLAEFDIIKVEDKNKKLDEAERKLREVKRPKEFYLDERSALSSVRMSPDNRFIVF